jgi:hypothetical protein
MDLKASSITIAAEFNPNASSAPGAGPEGSIETTTFGVGVTCQPNPGSF